MSMMTTSTAEGLSAEEFAELGASIRKAMNGVLDGKPEAVDIALTVLLAEGHLLIEDVPGVGKTMLARALANVQSPAPSTAFSSRPTCCPLTSRA